MASAALAMFRLRLSAPLTPASLLRDGPLTRSCSLS